MPRTKIHNILSVTPTVGRKISEFVFRDYYVRLEENVPEYVFDVFVRENVNGDLLDKDVIKDFVEYWGIVFRVKMVNEVDFEEI